MNQVVSFFTSSFLYAYAIAIVIITLLILAFGRMLKDLLGVYLLLAVGFGLLGITIGLLVGTSRQPAVNTIISSLLTFLAAFVTYILSKSSNQKTFYQAKLSQDISFASSIMSLIILPSCLFWGAYVGSINRMKVEEYNKDLDFYYQARLNRLQYEANVARDSVQHFLRQSSK